MAATDTRYARLEPLPDDYSMIQNQTVGVIGVGATGSHMAAQLARLGADLILIDRDYLEPQNLTTSALYTEKDVSTALPKAVAAKQHLQEINDACSITAHVTDLNLHTIDVLDEADVVLDGTDNLETRYLLNEYAVKSGTPWVHVSALGYRGEVMPIIPGDTPCFNCVFAHADGSQLATCETAGVLPATAATVASHAVTAAVQLLHGEDGDGMTRHNIRDGAAQTLAVRQREDCCVCQMQEFPLLSADAGTTTTALCGEGQYHVNPQRNEDVDLRRIGAKLDGRGDVTVNDHLLRFDGPETFTLFADGRAIIDAATAEEARSVYSRFVGQ